MKSTSLFLTIVLSALLAACSSGVKLNDIPVEDKAGSAVTTAPAASNDGSGVGSRSVVPVNLDGANAALPGPNVARVIYFDYDSYTIRAEFQSAIEAHARFLNANKTRKVALEGHTDERGGREYNLALGQKRAEAVRRALGLLGVNDAQMEAVSFGKEKPSASGNDEASFAKNRRAEVSYR